MDNGKLCFFEAIMEDHKLIKHVRTLQNQAFQNYGIGSKEKLLYSNQIGACMVMKKAIIATFVSTTIASQKIGLCAVRANIVKNMGSNKS